MNDRNHQNLTKGRSGHGKWASLLVSLAVLFCQASLAWSAGPAAHAESKIGPGILEKLRDSGAANVMIALAHPSSAARASGLDIAAMKSQIAQMQTDVLAKLGPDGYEARHTYSAVPALAGRVKSEAGLAALARHPSVLKVDLDVGGTGSLANSVPLIGADLRHALGNTGAGVVVAVLDSGLDTDHLNLGDDLITEECFLDNDGSIDGSGLCPNGSDRQTGPGAAEDDAGHGSHVTGIVTSNGALGSVGAAPDASIVAIKVTAGPSFPGEFSFFSEIVAALDYIINNPALGVQVINMSLVTNALFTGDCDTSTAYNMAGAAAINTLRANGVTAFASAGNNGSSTQMTSPACLSNVISVGASDNTDTAWVFTNSNASTDIFAPGVNILSSDLSNGTTMVSGTSMASPHAAGCAALLIQNGEAATPDQIEARLESSAVQVLVAANGLSFPRIDCNPQESAPHPCCNTGEPGCIDPDIEAAICAVDPFCCNTEWDALCVEQVTTVAGDTCDCCTGHADATGCFEPDAPVPEAVSDCVCAADPYCCEVIWDSICVGDVESFGCGICALADDADADGVADSQDNCTLVANPDQRDTDGDGIGNMCDCDFNQDDFCGGPDFTLFIGCFNAPTGGDPLCEAADMNGDGFVGGPDFTLFIGGFNTAPGPFGVTP